ncbi:putative piggyBac transposase Uribo1 [Danaus plexippus plexippus]|uniref:PiggyBac transposase Uribo1 n=1 Tax=Danaus plexippus plexippus TaxID=278856 RepID=A0A212EUD9_DANPL|nr:putative piggyBac transposase Uribo1 [Danaus plexippus plexippus]
MALASYFFKDVSIDPGLPYRISDTRVSLLKWRDKRSVFILSNNHDLKNVGKGKPPGIGTSTEVSCPQAIINYNANMNLVDRFDQLKRSYAIVRKPNNFLVVLYMPRPRPADSERIQTRSILGPTGTMIYQRQTQARFSEQ